MANRFVLPRPSVFDNSGLAGAGYKLYFYQTGTTTPLDTYSDNGLATPNANPVVADSAGRFGDIFLQDADYKVVLKTAADVEVWSADPVHGGFGVTFSSQTVIATGTTVARSLADRFADFYNVLDEIPQAQHAAILAGTSTYDASTDIQTMIDAAATDAAAIGAAVTVLAPPGLYNANVTLKDSVWLRSFGGRWAAKIKAVSGAEVIDTPVAETSDCGIDGFYIDGDSLVGSRGVRFRNVNRGFVQNCKIQWIDQQGILWEDGVACEFMDNFALDCLLDRTQAAKVGAIEAGALTTDGYFTRGEYTASLTGTGNKSDANLYLCAGLIKGSTHFVDQGVYETSDIGLRVEAVRCKLQNVRADLNQGHGFEITGGGQYSNCHALSNSQDVANTYDGFSVSGASQMVNCLADSASSSHRYGFNDSLNSDGNKSRYDNCKSTGHGTGSFNTQGFAGAAVNFPEGPQKTFTDLDTTPSVDQYKNFRHTYTAATTVTNLDDGVSGQVVTILSGTANMTIQYSGANFSGNGGVDRALATGSVVVLMNQNGVWYEKSYAV